MSNRIPFNSSFGVEWISLFRNLTSSFTYSAGFGISGRPQADALDAVVGRYHYQNGSFSLESAVSIALMHFE